jgi:hypothetical protein
MVPNLQRRLVLMPDTADPRPFHPDNRVGLIPKSCMRANTLIFSREAPRSITTIISRTPFYTPQRAFTGENTHP